MQQGDIRYTKDGEAVQIAYVLEDAVLAHPMQRVVYQDNFEEPYEEEEPADHLRSYNESELFEKPPVDVIDADLRSKREELEEVKRQISTASKDLRDELAKLKRDKEAAERDLDRWNTEHQHFIDLARLLDGKPMFPLHVAKSPYHNAWRTPYVPKWEDVKFICVTPNVYRGEERWRVVSQREASPDWTTRFFYSEADRNAFISDRFAELCEKFRGAPDFSLEGKTYGSRLDFGTLQGWCSRFPHLSIPEDIEAGKVQADEGVKAQKASKLRAELEALER